MPASPLSDRPATAEAESRGPKVYSVGEVNRAVRLQIEDRFGDVWIEGELSDVRVSTAGHVYFALNDEKKSAQLRGVMFRGDASRARAKLEDGARVRVRGRLSLYEERGQFQLLARQAVPAGAGDLALELERLKAKLQIEGLLDPARKRPLPRVPRVVGLVTSKVGAALQDILRVAEGRFPMRFVVADCRVQGQGAPESIVQALELIQRLPVLDVVIVGRGGGAADELGAFNDERVARAIASCRVPVVSAVGHETDVTIADLVADVRAATPSNAAELVVPDGAVLKAELDALFRRVARAIEARTNRSRLALERLSRAVRDPRHTLVGARQHLDLLDDRLRRAADRRRKDWRVRLDGLRERLAKRDPRALLAADRRRVDQLDARLRESVRRRLAVASANLGQKAAKLDAMSPLRVLERGYALALLEPSGKVVRSSSETKVGDQLIVRLHEGRLRARVEDVS